MSSSRQGRCTRAALAVGAVASLSLAGCSSGQSLLAAPSGPRPPILCGRKALGRPVLVLTKAPLAMQGSLKLSNVSPWRCYTTGYPKLTVIGVDGRPILLRVSRNFPGASTARWNGYPSVVLRPGQQTRLRMPLVDLCNAASRPVILLLQWQRSVISVPLTRADTPPCQMPGVVSRIYVDPFSPSST